MNSFTNFLGLSAPESEHSGDSETANATTHSANSNNAEMNDEDEDYYYSDSDDESTNTPEQRQCKECYHYFTPNDEINNGFWTSRCEGCLQWLRMEERMEEEIMNNLSNNDSDDESTLSPGEVECKECFSKFMPNPEINKGFYISRCPECILGYEMPNEGKYSRNQHRCVCATSRCSCLDHINKELEDTLDSLCKDGKESSCSSNSVTTKRHRQKLIREVKKCCCEGICPAEKSNGKGKGKKVKCPNNREVLLIANQDSQICWSDGRPKIGDDLNWYEVTPWMILILCKTRRQTHHIEIINPETGCINEYFTHMLDMLIRSIKVDYPKVKQKPTHYPYFVSVECIKDHGEYTECHRLIPVTVISKGIALAQANVIDNSSKDELTILLERFESAVMEAILAFDSEKVKKDVESGFRNPIAHYTRCPRPGCQYCNGFHCNPIERRKPCGRVSKIIQCPDPECRNEDGENTYWCTICNKKHLDQENCPLPDPRAEMSKEDLEYHDKEMREGREQVCKCGTFYTKDQNCDSVHCKRPGCLAHFCFGCGAEIVGNYTTNHMTYGPRENHPGIDQYGCRRTYARKAASNEESEYRTRVRAWLIRSISSRPLMEEARFVLNDPLRPLEEGEGKDWLDALVAQAVARRII